MPGDDGNLYPSQRRYGPLFKSGSVVGCGYDRVRKEIFYTLDGQHLGTAFFNVENRDFCAAVGASISTPR